MFFMEMVIIWLSLRVLRLFKRINSLLENFMFFRGKMVIIGFGHCHGNLAVK